MRHRTAPVLKTVRPHHRLTVTGARVRDVCSGQHKNRNERMSTLKITLKILFLSWIPALFFCNILLNHQNTHRRRNYLPTLLILLFTQHSVKSINLILTYFWLKYFIIISIFVQMWEWKFVKSDLIWASVVALIIYSIDNHDHRHMWWISGTSTINSHSCA